MKNILTAVLVAGAFVIGVPAANAISEAEIRKDIEEYQGYFLKRFPGVTLADYSDGVNALPQYAERRANWELLMEFPPYETEMDKAAERSKLSNRRGDIPHMIGIGHEYGAGESAIGRYGENIVTNP